MDRGVAMVLRRLAVGPEVRIEVETHPGAAREGTSVLVCWALDAATYEAYDRLAAGASVHDGDPRAARRQLAAAVAKAFEGVDVREEISCFGSLAGWFLEHPLAGRFCDDIMPQYLAHELPEAAELESVELAAYFLLDEQSLDRNPYEMSHREGCEREIWADRDEETLLAPDKVDPEMSPETKCSGCLADRRVYARAIRQQRTARWIDVARRVMQRSRLLEQFPPAFETTSARDWAFVEIVRGEVAKREAYLGWQAGQKGKGAPA